MRSRSSSVMAARGSSAVHAGSNARESSARRPSATSSPISAFSTLFAIDHPGSAMSAVMPSA